MTQKHRPTPAQKRALNAALTGAIHRRGGPFGPTGPSDHSFDKRTIDKLFTLGLLARGAGFGQFVLPDQACPEVPQLRQRGWQ